MRSFAFILSVLVFGCGSENTTPGDTHASSIGGSGGASMQPSTNGGASTSPTSHSTNGGASTSSTLDSTSSGASTSSTSHSTSGGAGSTAGASATPTTAPKGAWSSLAAPESKKLQSEVLTSLSALTADELIAKSPGIANQPLGYAPEQAKWLDTIQASSLALDDAELERFKQNGFVISERQIYPDFFYGYKTIYAADLPVYVTADAVLTALHRSYDTILKEVETSYMEPTLRQMLSGLRGRIQSAAIGEDARHDLTLLLSVALGLLDSTASVDAEASALIAKAKAASGTETVSLFGTEREIDFSQFVPRGHYADFSTLESYFRAMMWLGRTELRLVEVSASGERALVRRQVQDVLALDELFTDELRQQWASLERIVALFVGEADYMTLPQAAQLRSALGIAASTALEGVDDARLLATIDAGSYGNQRICSQLMVVDDGMTTLPNSFAFLGQRYTVDSHVFSRVVYPNTKSRRMMPNPLDVAFAAFGNDQAATLLRSELDAYGYAPELGAARQLVEWHGADYWDTSLYTLWTDSLRQLSAGKYDAASLPSVARTEAWGRRLINTQLASWAELRHDTLLYAKQSYTGVPSCEYPDGYVDPYPGLFARLKQLGTLAAELLAPVLPSSTASRVVTYFQKFAEIAARLETLATEELTGAERTADDLAFLNDAVSIGTETSGCSTVRFPTGWYSKLFYDREDALKGYPTIADVHTQPADEAGNPVGRVLHVATGNPRLMVVSVDSCEGPRAFAGVVSSYFEQTTSNFERKTDQIWAAEIKSGNPEDVSWMQDLVVR